MNLDLDPLKRARDRHSVVVTCIIDNDDKIDDSLRHHFVVSALQSAGCVGSRHYRHNFLAL